MSAAGARGGVPPAGARRQGRYAFLRTAAWARIIAAGVLVSLACAGLGAWQWNRHTARVAAVERVEENYDAVPVALADVLPTPGSPLAEEDVWRPVRARGTYVDDGTVLLRNRPVTGRPALHVLDPLLITTPGGPAVLVVDRGWVPAGTEDVAGAVPRPPTGTVDVVVRLREPERPASRQAPVGQTYTVFPEDVLATAGGHAEVGALPVLAAYGVLADEDPRHADAPRLIPRPDTDLGTHLSYTLQWWVLSLGALVGIVVLARREAGSRGTGTGAGAADAGAAARNGTRRRRDGPAEVEEDALLDQQPAWWPSPDESLGRSPGGR